MTFAGVESGNQCFCSDKAEFDINGKAAAADCNSKCPRNATLFCGGPWRVDVYAVCPRGFCKNPSNGENCEKQCHCPNENICDYETGNCLNVCVEGMTGNSCNITACPRGSYKQPGKSYNNCNYKCHCRDKDNCDYKTGTCPNGCETGWTGSSCQFRDCAYKNGGCNQHCRDEKRDNYCYCDAGYSFSGLEMTHCTDINECGETKDVTVSPTCHECRNTIGSYTCTCREGYRLSASNTECIDVDECKEGIDQCEGHCVNTAGSYNCQCPSGYELVQKTKCKDIDECARNLCEQNCTNTYGSYKCHCYGGYVEENQTHCTDIDECSIGNHICHQTCTNQPGGYTCDCYTGYIKVDIMNCVACWSQFELRVDVTSGVSSSCPRITVIENQSLEDCKRKACKYGGNVINQRPNICDIRNCSETDNLDFTAEKGGWNIYALSLNVSTPVPVNQSIVSSNIITITSAVLVPSAAIAVVLIACIVIYKRKKVIQEPKVQVSNQADDADDQRVPHYVNAPFHTQMGVLNTDQVGEGQYNEIMAHRQSGNYEGLDRETRINTASEYERVP